MDEWEPISLDELYSEIKKSEADLTDELNRFWQLIKVTPSKWIETGYGSQGGGFWVVAIYDTKVIWYNDIEEGFNISGYKTFGLIDEYRCEQDELNLTINKLFALIN